MMCQNTCWALARRFRTQQDGNVTIFSVFMVVLVLTVAGAAVDIMRFEATRAHMQSSMDRAVLAAADLDQEQPAKDVVTDYLSKLGLDGILNEVRVVTGENSRTVSADSDATLSTFFLRLSGRDQMLAPALSVAEEMIANVEVSLVLDISGSMKTNDRFTKMQSAAEAFVDKVMTSETNGVTTLNLVPFAGSVNPGDAMFDYLRGVRPKQNNGWGNGDQDAPGGSLCNNNAENWYEGLIDPSCGADGSVTPDYDGYFFAWREAISNMVFYFDIDGDDIYDRAYKIENFPEDAPRDADDYFKGAVAYLMAENGELTDPDQFLGASVKGGTGKAVYFQVKGNQNGAVSDLGPTKNQGRIPGDTYSYSQFDHLAWEAAYVAPEPDTIDDPASDDPADKIVGPTNINMPSSCVEVYDSEFETTALPQSEDYIPHFHFWPFEEVTMDWGWCPSEEATVQYYTSNKDQLIQFIRDLRLHDGTGTQIGMKYGLSLLDPANRDEVSYLIENGLVDPRFEGRPIDWQDPETEKYIVLMTDGAASEQVRPNKPRDVINGVKELQVQGATSYYEESSQSVNAANLTKQCDLAKQRGVTVFTIAFETDDAASNQMLSCASSASHYFYAEGGEIADVFDTIARQINNLRLIQ